VGGPREAIPTESSLLQIVHLLVQTDAALPPPTGHGVTVWDAESGREIFTLPYGTKSTLTVSSPGFGRVAFSPDGRRIAAADGRSIRIWNISTRRGFRTLNCKRSVSGFAFSPGGQRIATWGPDEGWVRIWNVGNGKMEMTLRGDIESGRVYAVAYSPDGHRLASLGGDEKLRLWDTVSGQEALTIRAETTPSYSMSFSPDGRYIAFVTREGMVRMLDGSEMSLEQQAKPRNPERAPLVGLEAATSLEQHRTGRLERRGTPHRSAHHTSTIWRISPRCPRGLPLPTRPLVPGVTWRRADARPKPCCGDSGQPWTPKIAAEVAWTCVRLHHPVSDITRVLELARLASRSQPENPWAAATLGLALYRASHYEGSD